MFAIKFREFFKTFIFRSYFRELLAFSFVSSSHKAIQIQFITLSSKTGELAQQNPIKSGLLLVPDRALLV